MTKDYSFGIIPYFYRDKQAHFLLVHHNVGHWSFPKGHKEEGETDTEAALRELKEETGVAVIEVDDSHRFLEHYTWDRDGEMLDKLVTFFLGETTNDSVTILTKEIQNYEWLPYDEALQKLSYPETKQILVEAFDYLKTRSKS
jgi:8-oxo-dGTP pyrophosphatase MutT (NUDIX family)